MIKLIHYYSNLAVGDVRHDPRVVNVHIQPVLPKVLGHHHARLDHPALLGELALRKGLA